MAKNDVASWDATPGNNTDINGINIAEGCPASGINDAIRTVMSQLATWFAATTGPVIKVAGLIANSQQVTDGAGVGRGIGYRNVPLTAKSTSYVLALTDVGQGLTTTAGVTVPLNATIAFAVGDCVLIYNNSASSITVTATGGVALRLAGSATTGNRTIALRGLCSLLKVGTDEWVASGVGVS